MTVVGVREGRTQASSHRRRSDALCSLVPPRLPSLRCAVRVVRSLLLASEKRVAAHEECVGRFAKKKQLRRPRRSPGSCWRRAPRLATRSRGQQLARLSLWIALQTPCRFPAVDDRHLQVHQDKVRPLGSRNLASFFAILGDQHFDLIGELKPHLEHVSVVLVVFYVENTEHGSPPLGESVCEYARRHLSSTTSTHHVNRAQNCLASCRLRPRRTRSLGLTSN